MKKEKMTQYVCLWGTHSLVVRNSAVGYTCASKISRLGFESARTHTFFAHLKKIFALSQSFFRKFRIKTNFYGGGGRRCAKGSTAVGLFANFSVCQRLFAKDFSPTFIFDGLFANFFSKQNKYANFSHFQTTGNCM